MKRLAVFTIAVIIGGGCGAFSWRYTRPHPVPQLVGVAERVDASTLASGVSLAVAEMTSPVTYVGLAWRAGAIESPADAPQLAYVVAATIFNDPRWDDTLRAVGGIGDLDVSLDGARLGATIQTKDVPLIVATLADIARHPTCETARLADAKMRALGTTKQSANVRTAELELRAAMYASDSVYGPVYGRNTATCDDLYAFASQFLTPDRVAIVVSGDVQHDAMAKNVNDSFVGFSGQARPGLRSTASPARRIGTIAESNAADTVIAIGRFMPVAAYDNALMARLVARIGPSAEKALRDDGLTYAVHTSIERRTLGYELQLVTTVPKSETEHALHVIVDAIEAAPYEHRAFGEPVYTWRVANLQHEILRQQRVEERGAILADVFVTRRNFADAFRDVVDLAQADIAEAMVTANDEIAIDGLSFVLVGDLAVTKAALDAARLD